MTRFAVICYGKKEEYENTSRPKVAEFYEECIYSSEGCERDRYVSVFLAILNGAKTCDDGWKWKFGADYDAL